MMRMERLLAYRILIGGALLAASLSGCYNDEKPFFGMINGEPAASTPDDLLGPSTGSNGSSVPGMTCVSLKNPHYVFSVADLRWEFDLPSTASYAEIGAYWVRVGANFINGTVYSRVDVTSLYDVSLDMSSAPWKVIVQSNDSDINSGWVYSSVHNELSPISVAGASVDVCYEISDE